MAINRRPKAAPWAAILKGTLGLKCALWLERSWQPVDIATNATALRAHHKPTINIEIIALERTWIAHKRRFLADYEDAAQRARLLAEALPA